MRRVEIDTGVGWTIRALVGPIGEGGKPQQGEAVQKSQ
jgi:hypothetical protein